MMKKMKQHFATSHQPYSSYNASSSMASGYPVTRPSTNASSTFGHLPAIPQNRLVQNTHGIRLRPASGLQLSVKPLPNSAGIQPTIPRERPPQVHRLSSSDSKALEQLRGPSPNVHPRRNSSGEHLLRTRPKINTQDSATLPLPHRQPSTAPPRQLIVEVLPPIGTVHEGAVSSSKVKELSESEEDESDSDTSSNLEDELFSEGSEAPPSRPGFESESEQSGLLLNIPFPDMNKSVPFPATLIQDHAHLDTERFSAGASTLGLSARVDNIVRALQIHGPLDKELLQKALNQVASLHSLLRASFQRTRDKLYLHSTAGGEVCVTIDTPVIGHESADNLIMSARRKIFQLPMRNDIVPSTKADNHAADDLALNVFSVTSVTGGSDSSDASKSPGMGRALGKKVSFAPPNPHAKLPPVNALPQLELPIIDQSAQDSIEQSSQLLLRAKLSSKNTHDHILVLSFPRIICDYWSSCLFVYQLCDAYSKLEKSSNYRPSLAATRIESKRQAVINSHQRTRGVARKDAASRLLQKRAQGNQILLKGVYTPPFPSKLNFQQIAQRESQLLLMLSREKLWTFWESMVTAVIRRQRGPNRVKVVPPIRIPSGLGEKITKTRPQTSRLRPLTASRNRPTTAKRGSGFHGDLSREAMSGPKTKFHYLKIEESVCDQFKQSLPEEYLGILKEDEILSLMCLGAYSLMLGKCCRGWGLEEGLTRDQPHPQPLTDDSAANFTTVVSDNERHKQHFPQDPLQRYKLVGSSRPGHKPVVISQSSPGVLRHNKRGALNGRLDLGSFLIGVEASTRHSEPQSTQGLFGPLTNEVGIRVNLDPRESFADLILSLWRSTLLARKHGHFPFSTIAEEVGLIRGLPIKFSYYYHRDIVQLTNPNEFYFPETAMGVLGQGLARFGSTCYLTPLNGKMDDNCHMELLLWESYDSDYIVGGIRYQPHVIRTELVEAFSKELCSLVSAIAQDPCRSALKFAQDIHPPFLNSGRSRKQRQSSRKPTNRMI